MPSTGIDFTVDDGLGLRCANAVVADEGGYTNNPNDRGKETIWGITRTFAIANGWNGDMKTMSRDQAIQIYLKAFWGGAGCQRVAAAGFPRLAYALMDWAVNSGQTWPMETLQLGLNLLNKRGQRWPEITADGVIGAQTIQILQTARAAIPDIEVLLAEWVNASRVVMVGHLAKQDATQEDFMLGWLRRIARVDRATDTPA